MEFDIGNIFYIVITLVVVIFGLLGKKKKPAGQGSGESEGQPRPGFLQNLEKAFNMAQPDPVVVDLQDHEVDILEEEELVDPTPEPMSEPISLMEEYNRMVEKTRGNKSRGHISPKVDSQTDAIDVIPVDDGDEATDFFEIVKDFDARTAVVYSAIINRIEY